MSRASITSPSLSKKKKKVLICFPLCDLVDSGVWVCWSNSLPAVQLCCYGGCNRFPRCPECAAATVANSANKLFISKSIALLIIQITLTHSTETERRNVNFFQYFWKSFSYHIRSKSHTYVFGTSEKIPLVASSRKEMRKQPVRWTYSRIFMIPSCHNSCALQSTACHLHRQFQVGALCNWQLTFCLHSIYRAVRRAIRYALLNLALSLCPLMKNAHLHFTLGVSCCWDGFGTETLVDLSGCFKSD